MKRECNENERHLKCASVNMKRHMYTWQDMNTLVGPIQVTCHKGSLPTPTCQDER